MTNTYNFAQKSKLIEKIGKIKKQDHIKELFNIARNDPNFKCTKNNYGVLFKIHLLSNNTLTKIEKYVDSILNNKTKIDSVKLTYTPYSVDEFNDYKKNGSSLSKHDKSIIKKHRIDKEQTDINSDNIIYSEFNTDNLSDSFQKSTN
jgi:hypothetical protein